jgi:hypothetical protein
MATQRSNRTVIVTAFAAIAVVALLQLSPTSPLQVRRQAAPVEPVSTVHAASLSIEMMAPDQVPVAATTTIGFRVLDDTGSVLRQFALPPDDTLRITISSAWSPQAWDLPTAFDEASGLFVSQLQLEQPGDYRVMAEFNFSGRPPLRQAGLVRAVAVK